MGNKGSTTLPSLPHDYEEQQQQQDEGEEQEQAPSTTGNSPSVSRQENDRLKKQVTSALRKMKRYPKSASVQRQKLAKLRQYCNSAKYGNHYVGHILNHHHGFELVKMAMKYHKQVAAVQDHACRVCTLMTRQDSRATISAVPLVLDAMKNYKRHVNIQLNGLAALSFWGMDMKDGVPSPAVPVPPTPTPATTDSPATSVLPHEHPPLIFQLVEAGALPVIFNTMLPTWREHNHQIQDKALKTLVILTSSSKDVRTAFVSATAWKALQNTMQTHVDKPRLQLKGIKILKSIAMDHPGAVSKRLAMVLVAMKTHIDDLAIQKQACALLLLLAATHPPSHAILWQPGGGREAILAAMQHHATQEDIQKTAILALQKLPRLDESMAGGPNNNTPTTATTTMVANATHDAIHQGIESMITNLNSPDKTPATLANICKALIRLASESHVNKLDIASAQGVQGILSAMRREMNDYSLQRYGCQALSQLADVEATKRAMVQEADAIPVIVEAMKAHTAPEKSHLVALHAILVLVKLSQLLANHSRIMPTVPGIVQAMQVHHDKVTIQHKAMVVLQKLVARFVRFKKSAVQAGALEAILDAMTQHAENTPIQRLGCQCLLHLHHKTTSMRMVRAGALDVLVTMMERHLAHNGIQVAAIRTIAEITQFTCHLEHWAIRVQGMRCLVLSVQMHLENPTFQKLAFELFQHSSKHYYRRPQLQRQLVQAGGIGAILTCMKYNHPVNVSVQQLGFRTLYNLSRNVHYGAIIFRNGGWTAIRQAQLVCIEDEFLQRYALTLIVKLVAMFFLHWFVWVGCHVVL